MISAVISASPRVFWTGEGRRQLITALQTIERHLKGLLELGQIKRVGSDKAGHWEVIERPS